MKELIAKLNEIRFDETNEIEALGLLRTIASTSAIVENPKYIYELTSVVKDTCGENEDFVVFDEIVNKIIEASTEYDCKDVDLFIDFVDQAIELLVYKLVGAPSWTCTIVDYQAYRVHRSMLSTVMGVHRLHTLRLSMTRANNLLVLIALTLIVAFFCGYWSQLSNPGGIWLYTPPADGSGKPSDAFHLGAALGCLIISVVYLLGAIGVLVWGLTRARQISKLFLPLATTAVIAFCLTVVLLVSGY